jgi:uncharacterized protein YqgC (DUF456 family)
MELVWYIIASIFLILGLIGCFISILPGPILSYLALFCLIPTDNCLSVSALVFFGVLTIVVTVADFIIPSLGAKKFNCSSYGVWGCTLGTFVGAFFFPIGIILGPFLGAFLGELISRRDVSAALRGGIGAFLGFLAGTLLKLGFCIYLIIYVVLNFLG